MGKDKKKDKCCHAFEKKGKRCSSCPLKDEDKKKDKQDKKKDKKKEKKKEKKKDKKKKE